MSTNMNLIKSVTVLEPFWMKWRHKISAGVLYESLEGFPCPVVGKEAWNYVTVRDGAHMFWWLYYADCQPAEFKDLPLVMWLQVGPRV